MRESLRHSTATPGIHFVSPAIPRASTRQRSAADAFGLRSSPLPHHRVENEKSEIAAEKKPVEKNTRGGQGTYVEFGIRLQQRSFESQELVQRDSALLRRVGDVEENAVLLFADFGEIGRRSYRVDERIRIEISGSGSGVSSR